MSPPMACSSEVVAAPPYAADAESLVPLFPHAKGFTAHSNRATRVHRALLCAALIGAAAIGSV